jgi:hypothetical protein
MFTKWRLERKLRTVVELPVAQWKLDVFVSAKPMMHGR